MLTEEADPLCCDRLPEFDTDGLPPHADKIQVKQRNPESSIPENFLHMMFTSLSFSIKQTGIINRIVSF